MGEGSASPGSIEINNSAQGWQDILARLSSILNDTGPRMKTTRNRTSHRISSWLRHNWYAEPPASQPWPLPFVLSLGARFYGKGLHYHQSRARRHRCGLPAFVISVGNLVVGGTGKTPFTLWLADHLRTRGWNPAILSRGYKRRDGAIARVPPAVQSFQEVLGFGDESVLMARKAKPVSVWVGKDRLVSGSQAIEADGADLLILDDGFQHLVLERNLDLVLLDAHNPFGNGSLLPLGPLREPVAHLQRADAIVLTRAQDPQKTTTTRSRIKKLFPGKSVFSCVHRLTELNMGFGAHRIPLEALRGKKAIAFAGIARPETFAHLLRMAGIVVAQSIDFPDHYQYREADMVMLLNAMKAHHASFIITTEKDLVRVPPEFQSFVLAAVLELDFLAEHQAFCGYLQERLPPR
jgi:tetraacyldisaccharide 4'-kinase